MSFLIELIRSGGASLRFFFAENFQGVSDGLEIFIIAAGIYGVMMFVRGTRGVPVIISLVALLFLYLLASLFGLITITWMLETLFFWAPVMLVVLFADNVRFWLIRVGRVLQIGGLGERQERQMLVEVVRACTLLSKKRIGALIVIEREDLLNDYVDSGQRIDAQPSEDLLYSLFLTSSPLHDGAVLIQRGRLSRAAAILPLTLRTDLPGYAGTRHRAAVGLSSLCDAAVVVVSEETGTISVVLNGELMAGLDVNDLFESLRSYLASNLRDASESEGGAAEGSAAPQASAP